MQAKLYGKPLKKFQKNYQKILAKILQVWYIVCTDKERGEIDLVIRWKY